MDTCFHFSWVYVRVELPGHRVNYVSPSQELPDCSPKQLFHSHSHQPPVSDCSNFFSPTTVPISFWYLYPNAYEVVFQCGFDVILRVNHIEYFFLHSFTIYTFFGEVSIHKFCSFFKISLSSSIELQIFFIYSQYKSLLGSLICKYFLLFCGLPFHFLDNVI